MLEYVENLKILHMSNVDVEYPDCKVLLKDADFTNMEDVTGTVYAISRSRTTFDELCAVYKELALKGIPVIIVGSYSGGDVGVQYISK